MPARLDAHRAKAMFAGQGMGDLLNSPGAVRTDDRNGPFFVIWVGDAGNDSIDIFICLKATLQQQAIAVI